MSDILLEVRHHEQAPLPTAYGNFDVYAYDMGDYRRPYYALVKGNVANAQGVLTRIHSACATSEIFDSRKCDCRQQLQLAQKLIAEAGRGVIVYASDHEGRGTGPIDKIKAYRLQAEENLDTVEANHAIGHKTDDRNYDKAIKILENLGVVSVRLMTNNPDKIRAVSDSGIFVVSRENLIIPATADTQKYFDVKRVKTGHFGIGLA